MPWDSASVLPHIWISSLRSSRLLLNVCAGDVVGGHIDGERIDVRDLLICSAEHMTKKGGGLFSFGGGGKDKQVLMAGGKKVKNTILLALGYVTSYAQPK